MNLVELVDWVKKYSTDINRDITWENVKYTLADMWARDENAGEQVTNILKWVYKDFHIDSINQKNSKYKNTNMN